MALVLAWYTLTFSAVAFIVCIMFLFLIAGEGLDGTDDDELV